MQIISPIVQIRYQIQLYVKQDASLGYINICTDTEEKKLETSDDKVRDIDICKINYTSLFTILNRIYSVEYFDHLLFKFKINFF